MATQIAEPTKQATQTDYYAGLQSDLRDHDEVAGSQSARVERRVAKWERDLADPRRRAGAYRRLVLRSDLPSNIARLICGLTEEFGARLENCFPSRRKMRARLGGWVQKHSAHLLTKWLTIAADAGWIERVPLTTNEHSELVQVDAGGRFTSATGIAFHVPAGVIAPGHPGVRGPRVWTQRIYGGRGTSA